jgi:hypothetical protein
MRTVVELANSNCTWCRDAMIDHLMTRPLVRQVQVNSATGCLVVDHDHDIPEALVAEVRDDLRGWVLAEDGEKVMVSLDAHEAADCPRHGMFEGEDGRSGEAT